MINVPTPYALVIAGLALIVGEIIAAVDFIQQVSELITGLVILYFILKFFGRNPELAEG